MAQAHILYKKLSTAPKLCCKLNMKSVVINNNKRCFACEENKIQTRSSIKTTNKSRDMYTEIALGIQIELINR